MGVWMRGMVLTAALLTAVPSAGTQSVPAAAVSEAPEKSTGVQISMPEMIGISGAAGSEAEIPLRIQADRSRIGVQALLQIPEGMEVVSVEKVSADDDGGVQETVPEFWQEEHRLILIWKGQQEAQCAAAEFVIKLRLQQPLEPGESLILSATGSVLPGPEESAEPTEPPEPEESAEPTESPEPEESAEPTEPPEPEESAEPTEPPEPEESAELTELPEPEESVKPTESLELEESAEPTESPEPKESTEPTESPEPEESAEPTESPEPEESAGPTESPEPEDGSEPPDASGLMEVAEQMEASEPGEGTEPQETLEPEESEEPAQETVETPVPTETSEPEEGSEPPDEPGLSKEPEQTEAPAPLFCRLVAETGTPEVRLMYTGQGQDFIPMGIKAVSILLPCMEGVGQSQVSWNDTAFCYSPQKSSESLQVYVGLVPEEADLEEELRIERSGAAAGEPPADFLFGDANGDGIINAQDALAVLDMWLCNDQAELSDRRLMAMNVNGDGKINVDDALAIIDYIVDNREFEVIADGKEREEGTETIEQEDNDSGSGDSSSGSGGSGDAVADQEPGPETGAVPGGA